MKRVILLLALARLAHADSACDSVLDCRETEDFAKGCALGDGFSCWKQGEWAKALPLADKGCDAGDELDCRAAGAIDFSGSPALALDRYEKGCRLGDVPSCIAAAHMVEPTDPARAVGFYQAGCTAGSAGSCTAVGLAAEGRKDYATAHELYERACSRGFDLACDYLGFLLEHGLGTTVDVARAFDLYQSSCTQSLIPKACYDEGRMFLDGKGTEQSDRAAGALFTKTCNDAGYGCAELARMIRQHRAPGAPDQALELDEKGCEANVAEACGDLAQLLERDADTPRAKVMATYERACKGGHAPSCQRLSGVKR